MVIEIVGWSQGQTIICKQHAPNASIRKHLPLYIVIKRPFSTISLTRHQTQLCIIILKRAYRSLLRHVGNDFSLDQLAGSSSVCYSSSILRNMTFFVLSFVAGKVHGKNRQDVKQSVVFKSGSLLLRSQGEIFVIRVTSMFQKAVVGWCFQKLHD